jgi:hypothetical protein
MSANFASAVGSVPRSNMEFYSAAGGNSCVIVADMQSGQSKNQISLAGRRC